MKADGDTAGLLIHDKTQDIKSIKHNTAFKLYATTRLYTKGGQLEPDSQGRPYRCDPKGLGKPGQRAAKGMGGQGNTTEQGYRYNVYTYYNQNLKETCHRRQRSMTYITVSGKDS